MSDAKRLLRLLPKIYEAATDTAQMDHLAPAIAHAFDCDSAIVYLCREPRPSLEFVRLLSTTGNFDEWARSSYATHYHERDEWFSRGIRKPIPAIVIGQELIDDRDFSRTEFCADWCERIGFFHVLGTAFPVDQVVGAIGLHRPRRAAQFGEAERRRMRLLMPHLQRAFELWWRLNTLEQRQTAIDDALDRYGLGMVLLDERGRVLQLTGGAEAILASADGLALSGPRLVATDADHAERLRKLIGDAAAASRGRGLASAGEIAIPRAFHSSPLAVLVTPLRTQDARLGGGRACVAVFLRDIGRERALASLARIPGLTRRQVNVVTLLLHGLGNMEIAKRLGISEHTVKDHLKDIFAKLAVRSRTELVAKVFGLGADGGTPA